MIDWKYCNTYVTINLKVTGILKQIKNRKSLEKDNFYKMQFCKTCDMNTVHRKLESLEILDDTKVRTGIPVSLARKIKIIYKNEEALFLREFAPKELEIDHKFPQIRWESDEEENPAGGRILDQHIHAYQRF